METKTLTLAEFLLARIGESERAWGVADAASAGANPRPTEPRWWLAECEAKRYIVEIHRPTKGARGHVYCFACLSGNYWEDLSRSMWPCATLRALALPFADHPDFRAKWHVSRDEWRV